MKRLKRHGMKLNVENCLIHGNQVGLSGIFTVNCECGILQNLDQVFICVSMPVPALCMCTLRGI